MIILWAIVFMALSATCGYLGWGESGFGHTGLSKAFTLIFSVVTLAAIAAISVSRQREVP